MYSRVSQSVIIAGFAGKMTPGPFWDMVISHLCPHVKQEVDIGVNLERNGYVVCLQVDTKKEVKQPFLLRVRDVPLCTRPHNL
jgi:hypothetical protein